METFNFKNEAGEGIGVFAAARDITQRKQAEEEVRELNRELEDRVQRATFYFTLNTSQKTELKSKAAAVGDTYE